MLLNPKQIDNNLKIPCIAYFSDVIYSSASESYYKEYYNYLNKNRNAIIEEMEKEEARKMAEQMKFDAEEARRKLEELRRYYDSLLEKKRQEIIAAAINMQEIPVEEEPEEVVYVDDEVRTSPAREDNHQPESIYHATGKSRTKLVDGHRETTFYVKKRVILPEREEREEVENETTLSKQDLIYSLFKKYKNEVQDNIFSIIPGQFIVKTNEGYYVNDNTFVENKLHATVFVDFNIAKQIKTRFGGKVIKL